MKISAGLDDTAFTAAGCVIAVICILVIGLALSVLAGWLKLEQQPISMVIRALFAGLI